MSKTKQAAAAGAKDAPQAETDFSATHRDGYAGLGGEYVLRDGKRVLLHRTREREGVPRQGSELRRTQKMLDQEAAAAAAEAERAVAAAREST